MVVQDKGLVEKARLLFLAQVKTQRFGYPYLKRHIKEVERWAKKAFEKYPEIDQNVLLLSVWLHDIGQLINQTEDHAIVSEKTAIKFLEKQEAESGLITKVAHCIRAHRCKDVQPETLEAKILAAIDSASHFTEINYIVHLHDYDRNFVLAKLERDYRDISQFDWLETELRPVYEAWKLLINVLPDPD